MAWPNRTADATDVWPDAEALGDWLSREGVVPSSPGIVGDAFRSADQLLRSRIDVELLTGRAAAAGIQTDEAEDDYDAEVLEAWCPAYVRQAILIRAAAIYSRRDSTNGTISFGEFATRVAKMDPDVDELMSPVVMVGIA